MSKKRRNSRKDRKKRSSRGRASQPMPPDRRAMERMLSDVGRALGQQEFESIEQANAFLEQLFNSGQPMAPMAPQTPLEEAQDVMYEAWEAKGRKRVTLARKALKISEDCADAYVLLAEEAARSLQEARDLYRQGVEAGERALGEEMFAENAGHFWGILETRPYMRARAGLAATQWQMGARDQAIEHLQEMLRLNPNDNQGVRYFLATCLLAERRQKELQKLLKQYEEDITASWAYTKALHAFQQSGASRRSRRLLLSALETNPHVPPYLLGKKRLPRRMPQHLGFGDVNEAVDYAASAIPLWSETPGALEWLEEAHSEAQAGERNPFSTKHKFPFQVGDAVAVQAGHRLEDYELDMSGWQGWVTGFDDDGDLKVAWDSQTLREMPEWAVEDMVTDGVDWTSLIMPAEILTPATSRDAEGDRLAVARERYAAYGIDTDSIVVLPESEFDGLDEYDSTFFPPQFEPLLVDEWLETLEIPSREHRAIRRDLRAGVGHFSRVDAGRDWSKKAPWSVLEELLSEPYIFGYAVLKILEDAKISEKSKITVILDALDRMQPAQLNGVPYGLLTLLGSLARFQMLPMHLFMLGLAALEFNSLMTLGPRDWMEGATKEAMLALVQWVIQQEELSEQEKLWLIWKISIHCDQAPHLGKALAQTWLEQASVPDESKESLCWGWLENEGPVGKPPLLWQLMDAYVEGDLERMRQIAQAHGVDLEAMPVPVPDTEMVGTMDDGGLMDTMLTARRWVITPPYLKRLAIPVLVRLGESLEDMAERYWDSNHVYYADALNNGIADAIAENHERLSAERLRRWVERGIGHSRAQTRKTFYMLSTGFYGDEYLQQALQDDAKSVRNWARKKMRK